MLQGQISLLLFVIHCIHRQYVTMVKAAHFMKTSLLFESKRHIITKHL